MPRCGSAGGVQLHEFRGDLPNGLARTALRLRPVRSPQLVQRGDLSTDITGQQVEGVGGDEQPVAGVAPLARRVLHHQVLTGGTAGRPLHHVDVLADAVLGVHHVVTGFERHRVDRVTPPAGHPRSRGLRIDAAGTGEVGLRQDRQPGIAQNEAVLQATTGDRHDIPTRRLDQPLARDHHADVRFGQPLAGPGRGAGAGHDQHRRATGGLPVTRVVQRDGQFPAIGGGGDHGRLRRASPAAAPSATASPVSNGCDAPNRQLGVPHRIEGVLEASVGRGPEVDGRARRRSPPPSRRRRGIRCRS